MWPFCIACNKSKLERLNGDNVQPRSIVDLSWYIVFHPCPTTRLPQTLLCTLQISNLPYNIQNTTPGLPYFLLRLWPSAAHLGTALVAAKARKSRADLCHQNGALVVHPVARLDAAHAAEAVSDAAATAISLLEHHKFFCRIHVPKSCDEIFPCSVFVTESQFQAMKQDPLLISAFLSF